MGNSISFSELLPLVRECLLLHWDPIGVNKFPEASDEYDSYVDGVCTLLLSGADAYKLRRHLEHIETVCMGLSSPSRHLDEVVARLLAMVGNPKASRENTRLDSN